MREKIRGFILENFMFGEKSLKDDDQLFESGIIDSLGFIKLLTFIERTFNISINMSEITIDKFSTINEIVTTIESKIK